MDDLRIDTDVEMTTRDGVVLRCDVYRFDDDLPRPVLLHRTPYDKAAPALVSSIVADPVALARAGYAVVVQDVRGRFSSDGELDFGEQEVDDGYDAVEWAAARPWCDGQVGVYGSSYHAITTYAVLAAAPPHLSAALVMIGAADLAPTVHPGGVFELGFLTAYSLGQVLEQVRRSDRPVEEKQQLVGRVLAAMACLPETVRTLPLSAVDVLDDPGLAPWWRTWVSDPSAVLTTRSVAREADLPDVPLLSVVGAMDFMATSMMSVVGKRPLGERHRLVLGPWAHQGTYTGAVGARAYAAAPGGVGIWQPVVQGWFDRWLRGATDGPPHPLARALTSGEPAQWFDRGLGVWRSSTSWPPSPLTRVWHLGADAGLHDDPRPAATTTTYRHEPRSPVPTAGGALTAAPLGPDGVQDQRGRQAHAGVVAWTSPVLDEPITLAGDARLVLHLSSTAEDTDVVVVLSDVEPDGFVANVTEGVLRARSRLGGSEDWLVPGETTELTVHLQHTAHTFGAGHRVRVDVAGSSFPRYSRNLGTREVPELGRLEDAVVSVQTVGHGGDRPSRLVLPVIA